MIRSHHQFFARRKTGITNKKISNDKFGRPFDSLAALAQGKLALVLSGGFVNGTRRPQWVSLSLFSEVENPVIFLANEWRIYYLVGR